MKIDLERITARQKLTIIKGLYDYQYIMENWEKNDADFQAVYYEFYLRARWAVMGKPENAAPYFDLLQRISPTDDLMEILAELKRRTKPGSYEFSLGSKLLHTRNPSVPIYDRKVREYLSQEEKVDLWWQIPQRDSGAPRGTTDEKKILHDWDILRKWYCKLLSDPRGAQWIAWFDSSFPDFTNISNVKKIDFIIYATN